METLMEEEEYNWREVILPSLIPVVPEPELDRENGERRRGRDIVIAVDHGRNSKHAFDWTVTHFCRLADTIHLVHVVSSFKNQVVYEMTQQLMEKLGARHFRWKGKKTLARNGSEPHHLEGPGMPLYLAAGGIVLQMSRLYEQPQAVSNSQELRESGYNGDSNGPSSSAGRHAPHLDVLLLSSPVHSPLRGCYA